MSWVPSSYKKKNKREKKKEKKSGRNKSRWKKENKKGNLNLKKREMVLFQVLKCINYNAYKIALPLDYGVSNTFNVTDLTLCDVGIFDINSRENSPQEGGYDRGLSKEEEFGLGGLYMDEPITWTRSKRFQEEFGKRLNSLMEEREEVKLIYFSQLLE